MTLHSLGAILTEPVSLAFLVLLLLLLALNLATQRRQIDADAMFVNLMLFAAWTVTKLIAWGFGWPYARSTYPLTDMLQGLTIVYLCVNRPAAWKAMLIVVFCSKCLMHSEFQPARDTDHSALYPYRVWLDVLFFVEILAVASSGGRIVAGRISSWMSGGTRHRGFALSRSRGSDH